VTAGKLHAAASTNTADVDRALQQNGHVTRAVQALAAAELHVAAVLEHRVLVHAYSSRSGSGSCKEACT
jgi:hypothetical protein